MMGSATSDRLRKDVGDAEVGSLDNEEGGSSNANIISNVQIDSLPKLLAVDISLSIVTRSQKDVERVYQVVHPYSLPAIYPMS